MLHLCEEFLTFIPRRGCITEINQAICGSFTPQGKCPANINQQWKPTNPQSLWAGYLILLQKFCQHKQIWPPRDLIWTDMSGLTTLRSVLHAFWVCSCHARHKQQRQISPSWSRIPSHLPLQQRLWNALCYRNQEVKMICPQIQLDPSGRETTTVAPSHYSGDTHLHASRWQHIRPYVLYNEGL